MPYKTTPNSRFIYKNVGTEHLRCMVLANNMYTTDTLQDTPEILSINNTPQERFYEQKLLSCQHYLLPSTTSIYLLYQSLLIGLLMLCALLCAPVVLPRACCWFVRVWTAWQPFCWKIPMVTLPCHRPRVHHAILAVVQQCQL